MQDEHSGFQTEIEANPFADVPRLVYADWLEERQDIGSEYLRLEIEFANSDVRSAMAMEMLERLANLMQSDEGPDLEWISWAGTKFDYVLHSFGDAPIQAIKIVRTLTDLSLMNARDLVMDSVLPTHVVSAVCLPALLLRAIPNQYRLTKEGPG